MFHVIHLPLKSAHKSIVTYLVDRCVVPGDSVVFFRKDNDLQYFYKDINPNFYMGINP